MTFRSNQRRHGPLPPVQARRSLFTPLLTLAVASAFAVPALAAPTPPAGARAPHVTAPASPLRVAPYRSAFDGYRFFAPPSRANWRDANDTAAALGGHAGHLKSPAAAPPAVTSSTDHESHAATPSRHHDAMHGAAPTDAAAKPGPVSPHKHPGHGSPKR